MSGTTADTVPPGELAGQMGLFHAQNDGPAPSSLPAAATVAAAPATLATSGLASVRTLGRHGRSTIAVDSTAPVRAMLRAARDSGATRVLMVGPAPSGDDGATGAEAARAWALAAAAPGWEPAGHYLADPDLPLLRFRSVDDGSQVTIMRAASWWGEAPGLTPRDALGAWEQLEAAVHTCRPFAGAQLADTPATTGRALWARTIPEGRAYDVQGDDVRELLAATAGQGRIELTARPSDGPTVPAFTVLDGRLMYAALTWGMPVGEPTRCVSPSKMRTDLNRRGRWLVRVSVPRDWTHVGLLPLKLEDGRWEYPHQPGRTFTTWADGAEVHAAVAHGWGLDPIEGLTWVEGKPLNTWTDALTRLHAAAEHRLVALGLRSILLHALGAFATRSHETTHSCSADSPELVGADAVRGTVHRAGDRLVWQVTREPSEWTRRLSHPEWSAAVWARARVRLGQLALTAPREDVLALSTDALYLARPLDEALPGIRYGRGGGRGQGAAARPDTGRPGVFRVKGALGEPAPRPSSWADVYRLRDRAQA